MDTFPCQGGNSLFKNILPSVFMSEPSKNLSGLGVCNYDMTLGNYM